MYKPLAKPLVRGCQSRQRTELGEWNAAADVAEVEAAAVDAANGGDCSFCRLFPSSHLSCFSLLLLFAYTHATLIQHSHQHVLPAFPPPALALSSSATNHIVLTSHTRTLPSCPPMAITVASLCQLIHVVIRSRIRRSLSFPSNISTLAPTTRTALSTSEPAIVDVDGVVRRVQAALVSLTTDVRLGDGEGSSQTTSLPSSVRCASISEYCRPFWTNEMRAPEGRRRCREKICTRTTRDRTHRRCARSLSQRSDTTQAETKAGECNELKSGGAQSGS